MREHLVPSFAWRSAARAEELEPVLNSTATQ